MKMIQFLLLPLALVAPFMLVANEVTTKTRLVSPASLQYSQIIIEVKKDTPKEPVVEAVKAEKRKPIRVGVLDFTTLDMKGQSILNRPDIKLNMPVQESLNSGERKSVNSIMQGFVKLLDAWSNIKNTDADRELQTSNIKFKYEQDKALYQTVVKGEQRPVLFGAEYLNSYLGESPAFFQCIESSVITSSMVKLQSAPDFPKELLPRLARETHATHLIYGNVSDIRKKSKTVTAYRVTTSSTEYELDLLIRLFDLNEQATVYSTVVTGVYKIRSQSRGEMITSDIFQELLKSATKQAAEKIKKAAQENDQIQAPKEMPITCNIKFELPKGFFGGQKPANLFIDNVFIGDGSQTYQIQVGHHQLRVEAEGYPVKTFDIQVKGDEIFNINLK